MEAVGVDNTLEVFGSLTINEAIGREEYSIY